MATTNFPSYAKILFDGYAQQRESALLRTEMESGPPRQAKVKSRVMITRTVNIHLKTQAEFAAFETWYANDLKEGSIWFNYADPVTGTTKEARFVDGGYSAKFKTKVYGSWIVSAKIESWG